MDIENPVHVAFHLMVVESIITGADVVMTVTHLPTVPAS